MVFSLSPSSVGNISTMTNQPFLWGVTPPLPFPRLQVTVHTTLLLSLQASITEHYNDQIRQLANTDAEEHRELIETITKFRDEEQEHHDIGLEHDAELAPAYQVLSGIIKAGCKSAIWLSERV